MSKLDAKIQNKLKNAVKGLSKKEIIKKTNIPKRNIPEISAALERLCAASAIFNVNGRYFSADLPGFEPAEIVKVTETFGFARPTAILPDGKPVRDVFIPGKMLMGAMPGDGVIINVKRGSEDLPEGKVVAVTTYANAPFSGVVVQRDEGLFVMPDNYIKYPMRLSEESAKGLTEGKKVLAKIISRGERHSGHIAEIIECFGDSDSAKSCCLAILAENGIKTDFPEEVLEQAREIESKGIHPKEIETRTDLRDKIIFTIDGDDTKDIDDAVSLEQTANGWELGVHIADVSYYVPYKSPLDAEAYERGTSVYYPGAVVPMLPKELSNGICSLNPGEDRLAFSALITLNDEAAITGFKFVKTVIRSRVQGVYGEINALLEGSAGEAITQKYAGLEGAIRDMAALALKLIQNRMDRGGVDLESTESKITISQDGIAVDITTRERGIAERAIEEFMLTANEAAATLAIKHGLPFIYRIHESPALDKIESLHTVLDALGVSHGRGSDSASLMRILNSVKGQPIAPIVGSMVLRSMSKAKYLHENIGHFGLSLKNYAHFTSPIRRYPDLAVHRILGRYVTGMSHDNIVKQFKSYSVSASARSTMRELAAVRAERGCTDCYKAEYMRSFIGECFDGMITAVTAFGVYVRLENSVEGLVRLSNFPKGFWTYDGAIAFSSSNNKKRICIGDLVNVKISGVNVSSGQVDMLFSR